MRLWSTLCGCFFRSHVPPCSHGLPVGEEPSAGGASASRQRPSTNSAPTGQEPLPAGPAQPTLPRPCDGPTPRAQFTLVDVRQQFHPASTAAAVHNQANSLADTPGVLADPGPVNNPPVIAGASATGPLAAYAATATAAAASVSGTQQLSYGSSSRSVPCRTLLQLSGGAGEEAMQYGFGMPPPGMADAAALAVATVARINPMPARSSSNRQGPTPLLAAAAAAGAGAHHGHGRPPSAAPHVATPASLSFRPADVPAQALLGDDSSTVSISSSDEIDDGLPSPAASTAKTASLDATAAAGGVRASGRAAAAAAAAAAGLGGDGGGDGGGGGGLSPPRHAQRPNAEEAAFIRGTLAALKQATLAGFQGLGEVEVLPGLPRVWSSHGGNRGLAAPPVAASDSVSGLSAAVSSEFRSPGSTVSGGRPRALHAVVHEANLAAVFGRSAASAPPGSAASAPPGTAAAAAAKHVPAGALLPPQQQRAPPSAHPHPQGAVGGWPRPAVTAPAPGGGSLQEAGSGGAGVHYAEVLQQIFARAMATQQQQQQQQQLVVQQQQKQSQQQQFLSAPPEVSREEEEQQPQPPQQEAREEDSDGSLLNAPPPPAQAPTTATQAPSAAEQAGGQPGSPARPSTASPTSSSPPPPDGGSTATAAATAAQAVSRPPSAGQQGSDASGAAATAHGMANGDAAVAGAAGDGAVRSVCTSSSAMTSRKSSDEVTLASGNDCGRGSGTDVSGGAAAAALPAAATAPEAEVAAFAQHLLTEQREVLAQLVREKWSPFSFPRPPAAAAAALPLPAAAPPPPPPPWLASGCRRTLAGLRLIPESSSVHLEEELAVAAAVSAGVDVTSAGGSRSYGGSRSCGSGGAAAAPAAAMHQLSESSYSPQSSGKSGPRSVPGGSSGPCWAAAAAAVGLDLQPTAGVSASGDGGGGVEPFKSTRSHAESLPPPSSILCSASHASTASSNASQSLSVTAASQYDSAASGGSRAAGAAMGMRVPLQGLDLGRPVHPLYMQLKEAGGGVDGGGPSSSAPPSSTGSLLAGLSLPPSQYGGQQQLVGRMPPPHGAIAAAPAAAAAPPPAVPVLTGASAFMRSLVERKWSPFFDLEASLSLSAPPVPGSFPGGDVGPALPGATAALPGANASGMPGAAQALPPPPPPPPRPQPSPDAAPQGSQPLSVNAWLPPPPPSPPQHQLQQSAPDVAAAVVPELSGAAAVVSELSGAAAVVPELSGAAALVPELSGADMAVVRSLVERKWSPFFDLEGSLNLHHPVIPVPPAFACFPGADLGSVPPGTAFGLPPSVAAAAPPPLPLGPSCLSQPPPPLRVADSPLQAPHCRQELQQPPPPGSMASAAAAGGGTGCGGKPPQPQPEPQPPAVPFAPSVLGERCTAPAAATAAAEPAAAATVAAEELAAAATVAAEEVGAGAATAVAEPTAAAATMAADIAAAATAVPELSGADMAVVRSLVERKWSPFFDLEASLGPPREGCWIEGAVPAGDPPTHGSVQPSVAGCPVPPTAHQAFQEAFPGLPGADRSPAAAGMTLAAAAAATVAAVAPAAAAAAAASAEAPGGPVGQRCNDMRVGAEGGGPDVYGMYDKHATCGAAEPADGAHTVVRLSFFGGSGSGRD
ncbi:hypothetical protein PLESTM_001656300 [Pleodorina starrii]|nr:hypothetical protein PLESTM_001656300 [Pleodorina starrii]